MKHKTLSMLFLLIMLGAFSGLLNGATWNVPGDKPNLATAIADLNAIGTISENYVINLVAGNPQTAPAGGYTITATGNSSYSIIIQGNGNTVTAFSPQVTGQRYDAIIRIVGGDYVTIKDFVLVENPLNTVATMASNTMTEFGVAIFAASTTDGAQNNTIQNNTITLSSTTAYQNAIGIFSTCGSSWTNGAQVASSIAGTNSFNKYYNNTISGVAHGLYFIGPPQTATVFESGNDIGGSSAATGNNITFGISNTAGDLGFTYYSGTTPSGIFFRNVVGNSARYNTITSNPTLTLVCGGIFSANGTNPTGITYTTVLSNNNITLTNNGANAITGIDFGSGLATGTIVGNNNTIVINKNSSAAVSAALIGIRANYTSATNTLNFNTITFNQNTSAGSVTSAVTGITAAGIGTIVNVNSNIITIKQEQTGTGSYGSGAISFIDVGAGSGTVNVNTNQLLTTGSTIRSTGSVFAISHSSGTITVGITINQNTITIDKASTSGAIYGTYETTTPSTVAHTISGNIVTFSNLTGTTAAYGISSLGGASATGTLKAITGNTVTISGNCTGVVHGVATGYSYGTMNNNVVTINTSGTTIIGLNAVGTGSGAYIISGNTLSLSSANTSPTSIVGINAGATGPFQIFNNMFSAINMSGIITASPTVSAIAVAAGTGNNVYSNNITNVSVGAATSTGSPTIDGILISGGTSTNVYWNKIYGVTTNCSGSSTGVNGIRISSGTTQNVYNNMIFGLQAPGATSSTTIPAIRGITVTGGTTSNIHYNSCMLDFNGANSNFASAGLYISGGTFNEIRNNIFVNKCTPGSNGRSVAVWKASAGTTNFGANSNKNIYWTGDNPDATRPIGYFVSTAYPTLAEYKAALVSRDQASYTENVQFLNNTRLTSLHIDPIVPTRVEGNAIPIDGVTKDFDNEDRSLTTPDIGADEGDFTPILAPPGTPQNTSPGNNSMGVAINTPLVWSASSEGGTPTSYEVYFDQADGSTYYATVGAPSSNPPKEFGKTYFWKVKAINSEGDAEGPVWNFSTASGVPSLTFPGAGATNMSLSFTFTWGAVPGVSGYKIKCGPSAGGPLVLDMVLTPTNSYALTVPLAYLTEYKWSVFSVNGAQEVQSAEWLFTTMADPNFYVTGANPYLMDFEEITTAGNLPQYWTKTTGTKWNSMISSSTYNRAPRSGTDYLTSYYSPTTGDYWMFSRPVYLNSDKAYDFGIWFNTDGYSGWTSFSMYIGTVANGSAMTTQLATVSSPINMTYAQLTRSAWQPPVTGSYVVGLIVYNNATPYYMSFDDFSVMETPTEPVFSVSPASKNWGTVNVFTNNDQIFTVSNIGSGDLTISEIVLEGDDCFSFVTPPSLPAVLNTSNPSISFTVRFKPMTADSFSGNIKITDDLNSKDINNVPLSGSGFDPIAPLPFTENFNASTAMPAYWTQSVSLWTINSTHGRTGNGIYKNIYDSVPNAWFQTQPIGPITDSTRLSFFYRLMNWSSYPSGGAFTPDTGDWVKIWVSTNEGATFAPYGEINSTNHTVSTSWAEKQVWLSGMKAENGDRIVLRFEANWGTGDWFIDIDDISVTHVATNPVFSINPTSKQYGDVEVGSFADQVFTISNLGLNPLVINDGGLSINGADATAYTIINTNPYPISITATPVTITVRFTPPAIRETPYAAALQIVDNTAKATQSVPLNGSGVGTYTLDVFAEGFNGTTFPPAGWSNYSITKSNGAVNPTGYWSRRTAGTYGSTAGAAFISWNYSSSVWACLEAPTLNLPSKSKLSFYWRDHDSKIAGQDTTFCEISTNGGTSWTVLAFLAAATTQTTYQKVDISLNAYAGSDRLLRFRDGTNTSSSAYGTFVDELSIVGGYDFPEGIPVSVGEEIITVTGGNANVGSGQVPPVVNTNFVASSSYVLNLIGSGPWTITIATSAPWGAYYQNGAWMSVENVGGFITFVITAAKDIPSLPIILGPVDPTLPVELSSFAATLTADMFVNVAWVAASETNHLGYNVLRSENNMLGNAIQINQNVITEGTSVGTQVSYSYLDTEVEANGTYYYWLESLDLGGTSVMHGPVSILVTGEPGDPGTPPLPPTVTKLMSAYPNPFNPSTNIRYSLKEAGKVSIEIYNVKGQLIRTYENNHSAPGYYQIMWDGRDASGRAVSSGLYLYRMISGHYRESRKMVLAK